jgi:hypothetical protein
MIDASCLASALAIKCFNARGSTLKNSAMNSGPRLREFCRCKYRGGGWVHVWDG